MIALAEGVADAVAAHARTDLSREVCGLLLGTRDERGVTVTAARPTANVAAEGREDRFTVDPRALLRIEEDLVGDGLRLVGVYHSHPRSAPAPSLLDRRAAALWPSFVHAIAGVGPAGRIEVRWYWSDSGGVLSSAVSCTAGCSSLSRGSKAAGSPPS